MVARLDKYYALGGRFDAASIFCVALSGTKRPKKKNPSANNHPVINEITAATRDGLAQNFVWSSQKLSK